MADKSLKQKALAERYLECEPYWERLLSSRSNLRAKKNSRESSSCSPIRCIFAQATIVLLCISAYSSDFEFASGFNDRFIAFGLIGLIGAGICITHGKV